MVPVYEGYTLPHAIGQLFFAGQDLTKILMESLNQKQNLFTYSNLELVEDIKVKLCYVALDYEIELENSRKNPIHTGNFFSKII